MNERLPGFEGYLWMGLIAPAATPDAIVEKLAAAAQRFATKPETPQRFDRDGIEPVGSNAADFKALISREIAQWRELSKTKKIVVD